MLGKSWRYPAGSIELLPVPKLAASGNPSPPQDGFRFHPGTLGLIIGTCYAECAVGSIMTISITVGVREIEERLAEENAGGKELDEICPLDTHGGNPRDWSFRGGGSPV